MIQFVTVTRSGCWVERGVEGARVTCGGLVGAEQVTSQGMWSEAWDELIPTPVLTSAVPSDTSLPGPTHSLL